MAQKLTKVAETTTLATTDTLIVVDESAQNPDGSTGALKRIPKSSAGFAFPSDITSAINTEVSNRNIAITNAINTEVSNRNNAISNAIDTEVTNRNNAIDEATSEIDNQKADKDGRYDEMTVGTAEDLIGDVDFVDKSAYLFRKSPAKYNRARIDEIVGGSIVWNQQAVVVDYSASVTGITFTGSANNHTMTANGTSTARTLHNFAGIKVNKGDVICMLGGAKGGTGLTYFLCDGYQGNTQDYGNGRIYKRTVDQPNAVPQIVITSGTTVNNIVFKPQVFNLTQMFGSTIADYIYSLETAQSGKGVAFFKSLFPNDYYPYNAGESKSVNVSAHKVVGFNAWDEEWEVGNIDSQGNNSTATDRIRSKNYIRVIPNTQYYAKSPSGLYVWGYDENKAYIGRVPSGTLVSGLFTTPSNCHYIRFIPNYPSYGTTYKNDICINLSSSRNGEYESYKSHSYSLAPIELRGIPKLNAQNELYFDGDIYSHDGKVQRKYGIVDLGTLTWAKSDTTTDKWRMYATLTNPKRPSSYSVVGNAICIKYTTINAGETWTGSKVGIAISDSNDNVLVYDPSYTDATAFKTAMNGVMLIYELATPTEETAEPFNNIQITEKDGTEQYISDSIVPPYSTTYYLESLEHNIKKNSAIIKSASGSVANFTDGGDDLPMKSLKVNIVPKQSGSGDPSPSNVRPISGTDTVNVNVCGVNVWDEEWENGDINITNGETRADSSRIRSKNFINVKPNTSYYAFWGGAQYNGLYVCFYDENKNWVSADRYSGWDYIENGTFTTPSWCYCMKFYNNGTSYGNNISINYPATDTLYHIGANNTSYPISLGQTVYGGTLDVTSGKLTIDMVTVDLGSLNWFINATYNIFTAWLNPVPMASTPTKDGYAVLPNYLYSPNFVLDSSKDKVCEIGRTGYFINNLIIRDTTYADASAFKTAMSGKVGAYKTATPIAEIQLTPTEVKTLLGNNNIWADSGSVEVEYRADTTLAYNELLSLIASLS